MIAGSFVAVVTMVIEGLLAEKAIYYGIGASVVSYVVVSLLTKPTGPAVMDNWNKRVAGQRTPTPQPSA